MRIVIFILLLLPFTLSADTIEHYMNIANQIPQMELKADQQAQLWARSARHVLAITNETIAETLIQANTLATQQGNPLFCLPSGKTLNADAMQEILLKTYNKNPSQPKDKNNMTISQIAWLGVLDAFPCTKR